MTRSMRFRMTALALGLLAAFGPALAQDKEPAKEPEKAAAPEATHDLDAGIALGMSLISGDSADRAQFGQYNGLRDVGRGIGLLGFDYYSRDLKSGFVSQYFGSNLFIETRELGAAWRQPGEWKLGANYSESVRYDPYTLNTGLAGVGTATPQVKPLVAGPGSGASYDLKQQRNGLGVSWWSALSSKVDLELSLKGENKDGAIVFGSGFTCPSSVAPGCKGATSINTGSAVLLLPAPIDSRHNQVDARINYAGDQLRVSAGYYGSFYSNANPLLSPSVPASLNNPVGTLLPLNTGLQAILNLPLALPPDNQSQQLDVTGTYAWLPSTQLRFKLAYTQLRQQQDFASAGLTGAPAGSSNLGGNVDTTLAQIGVTSRPNSKLSLLADVRYEDKNDRTPIALYNVQGTSTYTNQSLPLSTVKARLQASYRFTPDYLGTAALGYESIDRGIFTPTAAAGGVSALRQTTDETGYKLELRRTLNETFSGAISLEGSQRDGSNWLKPNSGTGVTEVTDPATAFPPSAIFMPSLADRQRDKVRVRAEWQPAESLSLQFTGESGRDSYSSTSQYGVQKSGMDLLGIDWDYAVSEAWRINGWITQGKQTLHQSRSAGYILSFDNYSSSVGIGTSGRPMTGIEIGGSLTQVNDKNVYAQSLDTLAPPESVALLAATGGLPNVIFRQTELKLFGRYDIDKQSALRADLVFQRSAVNDWAWGYSGVPFAYSDGSTLSQQPNQSVTMFSIRYVYRWR
jgi:MtrB/PioB family decaheme-associated outer membrane protein